MAMPTPACSKNPTAEQVCVVPTAPQTLGVFLGIGHDSNAVYQLFSLTFGMTLIALPWTFARRAMVEAKRELPRYATAGEPLRYSVKVWHHGKTSLIRARLSESPPDPRPNLEDFSRLREPGEEERNRFDRTLAIGSALAQAFTGISLGSILLLAALGLAITYGLMGVINMAHGELIMIGAYATYAVHVLFRDHLPAWFDWYLLAAVPVATPVDTAVLAKATVVWIQMPTKAISAAEREPFLELKERLPFVKQHLKRLQPVAMTLRHSFGPPYEPGVPVTRVMLRGEYDKPGEPVEAGFLSCITGNQEPAKIRLDPFKRWPTRSRRRAATWPTVPQALARSRARERI